MNVGAFILPGLAVLIVVVIAYVSLRWVINDPDTFDEPGSPDAKTPRRRR